MSQIPGSGDAAGGGDRGEENLRRLLEEIMGGQLPEEALAGMDLGRLAEQMHLPDDPEQLRAAARQMQQMFGDQGLPGMPGMPGAAGTQDGEDGSRVNWPMVTRLAKQVMDGTARVPGADAPRGTTGDPSPTAQQKQRIEEAAHVAQMWLAPVLAVDVPRQSLEVWGRGTWLHRTQERWKGIVEPVATHMSAAIGEALSAQMGQLPTPVPGDPAAMMERMGGTMFAMQFGMAIGELARETVGTTDLGLPLGPGAPALIAPNVEDLIAAHDLEPAGARIFLAAREIAHAALFQAAPWLPKALISAIEDYARGVTLDLDALDEMVRGLDMSDLSALQSRRPEQMFTFTRRPSQERALEELATTLALVEGWVDHVTTRALGGRLPQLEALRELWRRRRVSGSPAEETLASTIGIAVRPRLAREALAWWDSVLATEGEAGRERVWEHPDMLPSAEVLSGTPQAPAEDTPPEAEAKALPESSADFDEELRRLLEGEGAGRAPREDEQGGLREDDGPEDGAGGAAGDDAGDGPGPHA